MSPLPPHQPRQVASKPEALSERVLDATCAQLASEFNSEAANAERRTARGNHRGLDNTRAVKVDVPAAELGAVADAMAGADKTSMDGWRAETDLWDELAVADADYAAGNTISGEDLRRRYGLS
jgi:hypothetical protein